MGVERCSPSDCGYAMAALLVAMGVIAVVLSTTLPVFSTMARRERETELIFRGQQYARAVTLFQRKYGNALPPNLDILLTERFLRKQYKDPITKDDFQLIGPGSPELALAANAAPAQAQAGRGGPQLTPQQGARGGPQLQQQQGARGGLQQPQQQSSGRGLQSTNPVTEGTAPGGIIGVVSKSKDTSLRIYNNHDKYNEWVFMATQMSVAAGGGATGAQAPGGRGGQPLGGARGDGRGRRGDPTPPGRFGQPFQRGTGPGPGPGGSGMAPQGRPGGGRF
jgi:type II secretory pathway pseudopilin PulG